MCRVFLVPKNQQNLPSSCAAGKPRKIVAKDGDYKKIRQIKISLRSMRDMMATLSVVN